MLPALNRVDRVQLPTASPMELWCNWIALQTFNLPGFGSTPNSSTNIMKYFNGFEDKKAIAEQFEIDISELESCNIVFAAYTCESYEGSALILFEKNDKLYEVSGSHCSCNGLEGQWQPEETSLEALKMRDVNYYGFQGDLKSLFIDIIFEREVLN